MVQGLIRHSEVMERDAPSGEDGGGALQRALSHSLSLGEVRCRRHPIYLP